MAGSVRTLALVRGVPRTISVYDDTTVLGSAVTSGTAVTLPGGQSYLILDQLSIYLNGQKLDPTSTTPDYAVSGSSPYTAVTFAQNLVIGDILEFRIETTY